MWSLAGTPLYRAPEMFGGGGYSERVDTWALGVTLYQMVVGKTPFESIYHADTINNIRNNEVNFDY
jgi:serine/threonine protein kinase